MPRAPKSRSIRDWVSRLLLGNLIPLSVKPLCRVTPSCHCAYGNVMMISYQLFVFQHCWIFSTVQDFSKRMVQGKILYVEEKAMVLELHRQRGGGGRQEKQEEGDCSLDTESAMYSSHCCTLEMFYHPQLRMTGIHIARCLCAGKSTQAHPALVRSHQQEGH